MANIDTLALRTRIREVLEDGAGLVRVITAGRIDGDYWTGAGNYPARARALTRPRFDIPTIAIEPLFPSQFELCNTKWYTASITIECEYALPASIAPGVERDTPRATAEQDADVFRQALGWAGNLTETVALDPTGLVDGFLEFVRFEPFTENWEPGAQRLTTRHFYRGHLRVDAATS